MKYTRSQFSLASFLLGMLLVLSACSLFNDDDGAENFAFNERKWEQTGTSSYSMKINRSCFCPAGFYPARVVIRADTVYTALNPDTNEPIPIDSLSGNPEASYSDLYPTIDTLFELIQEARRQQADKLEVIYNDEYGYPEKIAIDYGEDIADDEISYRISKFSIRDEYLYDGPLSPGTIY